MWGGELPEVVATLLADPDSEAAREELVHRAFAALNADPAKVVAAAPLALGRGSRAVRPLGSTIRARR